MPRNSTHLRGRRNYRTAHTRSSCSNARSRRSSRTNCVRRELGRHTTDNKGTRSSYCTVRNHCNSRLDAPAPGTIRTRHTRSSSRTARSCCNLGPRTLPRNARRCILGQLLLAWYHPFSEIERREGRATPCDPTLSTDMQTSKKQGLNELSELLDDVCYLLEAELDKHLVLVDCRLVINRVVREVSDHL